MAFEETVLLGSGCAENVKGLVVRLDGVTFTATVLGKFDTGANENPLLDGGANNGMLPNKLAVAALEKRLPDGFAVVTGSKTVRGG